MNDSRTKNTSRNIVFGVLYKIVTLMLPFVTRTLILYLLGASYLGVNSLFSSILNFLSLAELGLTSAIVFSMYKPIADEDTSLIGALLNYYRRIYRYIGGVILVLGIALIPFIQFLVKKDAPKDINLYILYLLYLVNSVIGYFIAGYRQSLLQGYQRADIQNKIAIAVTLMVRLSEIFVLYATRNFYIYAIVPIVGTVISNIIIAAETRRLYPEVKCRGDISDEMKDEIRKKLGGLFGTKLNSIVINQADTIVISVFLGLTVVAMYGNYYYILSTVAGFIVIFFSSMTASIGNKIATDSVEDNYSLFRKLSFINAWIVGWCSICMLCLYQPFMRLWVGDKLMLPMATAALMVVYFYIYQIQRAILTFKDAAGLWYEDRYRPYAAMVINLASNIILVWLIGINGVVISTILAFSISLPWCNYVLFAYFFKKNPWTNLFEMLKQFIITGIIGVISFFVCNLFPYSVVGFIYKSIFCIFVPNIVYFMIYYKSSELQSLLKQILVILRRRKV